MSFEWVSCKLGDVASFRQGLQVSVNNQKTTNDGNCIKFIRISDLTSSADSRFIEKSPSHERYTVSPDDVIMVRYGDTGFVGRGQNGVIANNLFSINPSNNLEKGYLYYFLKQKYVFEYLKAQTTSAGIPAITHKIVSDLNFTYPEIRVQKEISSFLSPESVNSCQKSPVSLLKSIV